MNARAARALRLAAIAAVVGVVLHAVGFALTRWLLSDRYESRATSFEAIRKRLEIIGAVQQWGWIACLLATLVALGLLFAASSRQRARRLAAAALSAGGLQVALVLYEYFVPLQSGERALLMRQVLRLVEVLAANAALALALFAATPMPRPRNIGRTATTVFIRLVGILIVFRVISLIAPPVSGTFSSVWSISWVVVAAAGGVAFAVAASGLARHLLAPGEEVPLPPPASAEALALLPRDAAGPLRLFRQTIVVRAAVGVPLAVVAAVSMAQGAAELGGLALVVACITSLIVAGMQVTSLSGQRRFPEAFCNRDALSFAIVIACLAPVLDIVGGIATGQLMSLVSAAKHASSFWGMPSFRDIENLQAVASWTGRISMGLGLAGSYAVVSSLAATARGLANQELEDRARLARSLLLWGASVGIIAVILINNIRLRGDESIIILLLIAATLLSLGIALLVVLLRLASGLADAIEWRPPPGAAPEIGPPPTAAVS